MSTIITRDVFGRYIGKVALSSYEGEYYASGRFVSGGVPGLIYVFAVVGSAVSIDTAIIGLQRGRDGVQGFRSPITSAILSTINFNVMTGAYLERFCEASATRSILVGLVEYVGRFYAIKELSKSVVCSVSRSSMMIFKVVVIFGSLVMRAFCRYVVNRFTFSRFRGGVLDSTLDFLLREGFRIRRVFSCYSKGKFTRGFGMFRRFFF